MIRSSGFLTSISLVLAVLLVDSSTRAEDWPTYLHDSTRSGVTSEALQLPLKDSWLHRSPHPPSPAWPPPAKQDFWHHHRKLQPEVTYDRAYHVAVAGASVLYGSSADDKVYCVDATTGEIRWTFFTDGPVRLAPTIAEGRALVGSDDGCVYCLDVGDGALLWKRRLAPTDRRIPGNGRVISTWPVRTGVLVDAGVAYAGAGLFPTEGTYLHALHPDTGAEIWNRGSTDLSPQGYLFASPKYLYVPAGRTAPSRVRRDDGGAEGELELGGGAFAVMADDVIASGPGRTTGAVDIADADSRERIASFPGLRLLVHEERAYLQSEDQIAALDRTRYVALARERLVLDKERAALEKRLEGARRGGRAEEARKTTERLNAVQTAIAEKNRAMEACFLWRRPSRWPYALILAGETLFAGGEGEVAALGTSDGKDAWSSSVEGRAYGLAVSGGRLLVSTDSGAIHCFVSHRSEP